MGKPELNLWWEARQPAEADDARRLSRFVTGLPDFDAIYQSWLNSPTTEEVSVPAPLSEAEAKRLLVDNMARYDSPDRPWPELGSHIWGGHAGPRPYDFRESSYADTDCHVGAFGRSASANPNYISCESRICDRPPDGRGARPNSGR